MITKVAFFCYAVSDIPKARKFYEGFLGLKSGTEFPAKEGAYFIEYEIGDNTLAIGCSPEWPTSETGASIALEVDDFDNWITKAKDAGITIKNGPHDFPTCKMIVLCDPDKNPIVLHAKK